MKHRRLPILGILVFFAFHSCTTTPGGGGGNQLSLEEAIEQSAQRIAAELPPGSRVAIVAFESPNDNLSDFIMEELTGALIDNKMEVADRQNPMCMGN